MSTNRIYNYFCGPRNARTLMASKSLFSPRPVAFQLPRLPVSPSVPVRGCWCRRVSRFADFTAPSRGRRPNVAAGSSSTHAHCATGSTSLSRTRCLSQWRRSVENIGVVGKHVLGWVRSGRGWTSFAAGVQEYNPRKICEKFWSKSCILRSLMYSSALDKNTNVFIMTLAFFSPIQQWMLRPLTQSWPPHISISPQKRDSEK